MFRIEKTKLFEINQIKIDRWLFPGKAKEGNDEERDCIRMSELCDAIEITKEHFRFG